ncbi:DUF6708 domain-containing protein [Citrobacter sp. JGM124]|uniref:DUF6708 domain-containing protein n=1 Tax=Citrobacter sp. JGM124 TaxID=2799789 RepID=UPI001BAB4224|nr:DUF6708 domain-containing protein [Citrobacter sp. JGM124]MBS0846757.1 hypothetical protein [Citrobacter sp. JGM124]
MGKIKRRLKKQAERAERNRPPRSRLDHPVEGWTGDMPDKAEGCGFPPRLIWVNELNDVWMETPRYVNFSWGMLWPIMSLSVLPLFISVFFLILLGRASFIQGWLAFIPCTFFSLCFFIYLLKEMLFEPRGAPVRFNRKRQKVYVYEFQKSFWPWKRWHPVIKIFDWKDIHGEWVMRRAHADWGHRIYCAVCKPGTLEVVDRFILTWTVGGTDTAGGLWSFCCHYMEKKPVPTAPVYPDKPRDWTPFKTVRWPAEVALESSTAPDGEQPSVTH